MCIYRCLEITKPSIRLVGEIGGGQGKEPGVGGQQQWSTWRLRISIRRSDGVRGG